MFNMGMLMNKPAASGTSYVNSIQQVSITIPSGASSATATITAVDTSKTFLIFQGFTTDYAGANGSAEALCKADLTDSTTVTLIRGGTPAGVTATYNFIVVEGTSNLVSSVQYGTITTSGGTGTATISSINTNNSEVFLLGNWTGLSAGVANLTPNITLTNSTTVTGTTGLTTITVIGFVAVEFNPSAIASIQRFADSYANSNTTDNKTITSVNTNNCLISFNGQKTTNYNTIRKIALTSSTNVALTRTSTNASTVVMNYSVIEFVSGVINSVQRGSMALTGVSSNTGTISSVNTSKTALSFLGQSWEGVGGFDGYGAVFPRVTLTDATTVTGNKGAAGTDDVVQFSYQATEFN